MSKTLNKSLILRLGFALASITALAFIGMLSSMMTVEATQGAAGAINIAGSLRMQAYHIATDVIFSEKMEHKAYVKMIEKGKKEFDSRLYSPRLVSVITQDDHLKDSYDNLVTQWQHQISPTLQISEELTTNNNTLRNNLKDRYLTMVDGFVGDINQFVALLEQDTEAKIQNLRMIQSVVLFLTLLVVTITMYLMHTKVVIPLGDLLRFAERARVGDFSLRPTHTDEDELGQLGYAFNVMAQDLSKIYADLEQRVQIKTADLERTNCSLELLYNTIRRLNDSPLSAATYNLLLHDIESQLGLGPSAIRLCDEQGEGNQPLIDNVAIEWLCTTDYCNACASNTHSHIMAIPRENQAPAQALVIPVRDRTKHHGIMIMAIPDDVRLEEWHTRLLEAVAHHIAQALETSQRETEGRRLALLEERSVIARELHDSLAQSLSYLKIQISRLGMVLNKPDRLHQVDEIIVQLREGISAAYHQLRELLTTFRLSMDARGLCSALENTVNEFAQESGINITLDFQLPHQLLTAHQEIHLHQLLREAISNLAQHSQAKNANVLLQTTRDGRILARVTDDGIGIPDAPQRRHHYGLAIMQERARSLGGEIQLNRGEQGGTCIELSFLPAT